MPFVDALLDRWRRLPPLVVDVALAVVVAAVTTISLVVDDGNDPERQMTGWGWGLQSVQFVALVGRRRAPALVATIVGLAAFTFGAANQPDPTLIFPLVVAIYSVAAYSTRRVSLGGVVVVSVASLVTFALDRQTDAADIAVNYAVGITSWVVGDAMRTQRERARWLAERQEAEAERAAADERVRIARDLHDIVAHHLSVVVVQTEAAQEVLATNPGQAETAMAAVGDTARTALTELRRALGVLRADAGRAPQAGLDDLDDLVASVRAAGLAVDLRTEVSGTHLADADADADGDGIRLGTDGADGAGDGGRLRVAGADGVGGVGSAGGVPVPAMVGTTAYRVVQEALTNVLRHADARRACVEVGVDGGSLVVLVSDDGRGPSAAPPVSGRSERGYGGHGLVGMRERVTALGGELATGHGPGGGFVVRAVLPLVDHDA